jgi:hypothetical protein
MTDDAPPELFDVANIEDGFFDLLSVKPVLGRVPHDGDEGRAGTLWGALISYAAWQARFGGDPNVLGRTFRDLFVIVGVLPRTFVQPAALVGKDVEFWVRLDPKNRRYNGYGSRAVKVLAQLEPGVPLQRMRHDLSAAQTQLAAEQPAALRLPDGGTLGIGINSLRDATVGAGERPILIFLGAAALLLLLAGVNAANLVIVRGLDRDGELSLRRALGAGLLFRSFLYLRTDRLGFEPKDLMTFSVMSKSARPWETWNTVVARVAALPGVTSVAAASSLPFQTPVLSFRAVLVGQSSGAPVAAIAGYAVSPTFFATAKIPVVRGRAFDSSDQPASRRVAIINERFARATFGERDPIGQRISILDERSGNLDLEVVGVVGDVVQARLEDGMQPAIYVPHTQAFAPLTVLAATRRDPEALAPEIRRSLMDAGLRMAPVLGIASMRARIADSLSTPRFQLALIGGFAGVAVLLAAIGLYGTLAFSVRSRGREIGIRMAMGATQQQIVGLVVRQSVQVLGAGLGVGLVAALALTWLLRGFLYRVSPVDPVAFVAGLLIVVVAVLVASIRPAGRAARVDPMVSMRTEA